ncbi:hypothetical protein T484DRAFT_1966152, partial [Baffinella frigidus]
MPNHLHLLLLSLAAACLPSTGSVPPPMCFSSGAPWFGLRLPWAACPKPCGYARGLPPAKIPTTALPGGGVVRAAVFDVRTCGFLEGRAGHPLSRVLLHATAGGEEGGAS